jgi:hypothetical protein
VFNDTLVDKTIRVVWSGQSFAYTVPSKASITFKWAPAVSISERTAPPRLSGRNVSVRQTAGGISVRFPFVNNYTVELIDVNGRALMRRNGSGNKVVLDKRGLGRGIYFVRVLSGGMTVVKSCVWDGEWCINVQAPPTPH